MAHEHDPQAKRWAEWAAVEQRPFIALERFARRFGGWIVAGVGALAAAKFGLPLLAGKAALWWARARIARGAQVQALGRWAQLATRQRSDGEAVEMAMQQNYLAGTMFSPLRLLAWILGGWAAIATVLAGWFWAEGRIARANLADARADEERAQAALERAQEATARVVDANQSLTDRAIQAEAAKIQAEARAQQAERQARTSMDGFGRRQAQRAGAQAAAEQSRRRRIDAAQEHGGAGGGEFDGARWMRDRAEAAIPAPGDADPRLPDMPGPPAAGDPRP